MDNSTETRPEWIEKTKVFAMSMHNKIGYMADRIEHPDINSLGKFANRYFHHARRVAKQAEYLPITRQEKAAFELGLAMVQEEMQNFFNDYISDRAKKEELVTTDFQLLERL